MDRRLLSQLAHHLRPLQTRIANVVARAVVKLADDTKMLQLLQLGVLAGEGIDQCEYHQPYGFSSVPLAGAEAVVVFPNGDRSHPLVISASDRRYRPANSQPGEVVVYNNTGATIRITKDGDIIMHAAAGRTIQADDGSGAEALVTQAQFMNHTHLTAGTGSPVAPTALAPLPAPQLTGTTVLQGK